MLRRILPLAATLTLAIAAPVQASDCFLGEIRLFAGDFAPRGYEFAHGQLISIGQNPAVFAILGTNYGGDGSTTFALPDLRGRAPVGVGQGPGLSNRRLGEMIGAETVTLTEPQLPSHSHAATTTSTMQASNGSGDRAAPGTAVLANSSPAQIYKLSPNVAMDPNSVLSTTTVAPTGGGAPVPTQSPATAMNYIICMVGTFPTK